MVELKCVSKQYEKKKILDDVSFSFNSKGFYILKGESGCGKTTLLNIISKRIRDYNGEVNVKENVFYLSLDSYLIEEFTVKENISFNEDLFKDFKLYKNDFGIKDLMKKKVSKLSRGEKQRVGLFIALSSNCKIILLDETLSGVDKKYRKMMVKELEKICLSKLVILVSHQSVEVEGAETIYLKNGKLIGKNKALHYCNIEKNNKLTNQFKWSMKAHLNQLFARCIFIIYLFSLLLTNITINNKMNNIEEQFNDVFFDQYLYYKNNSVGLNVDTFYDNVVRQLAHQIEDYFYNFYSEEMDEVKVLVGNYYIDNGYVFSNLNIVEGLKEDEIVLEINNIEFCLNNKLNVCYKNQIKESLKGRYLYYKFNNYELKFLIKDVLFGEENKIYFNDIESLIYKLNQLHRNNQINYYISIYKNKIREFYNLINSNELLLSYNFDFISREGDLEYFLVSESKEKYFSKDEINQNNLLACSDISISCNSFNFSFFNTLMYIDTYDVFYKVKYQKKDYDLSYQEIVISQGLADYLNKSMGDKINLKFYMNDLFYNLENVTIKEVVNDKGLIIYHDKYDFDLFNEKFNVLIRSKFAYSDKKLYYQKTDSFDSDYTKETKLYLNDLFNIVKIAIYISFLISICVLFIIESVKFKRHLRILEVIVYNNARYEGFYMSYILFYFSLAIIFIFNYILLIIYLFLCFAFYLYNKRKIKSRFPWI